uniref:Integrase catalytic domain-containing protein n=1 Tax=Tanacetum cinerariifolium TaxID=118510 RepID=A0A6L2M629_TANCI|nr:hypothetical protein [Tanacetum cinerariifolium]
MKGIKREFSVSRTPQQNGVAERKNETLIEVTRTMLVDSLLPTTFLDEAVNTACYVQNRVLVTKPHNKTSYELLIGRSPNLEFMRPFGCPVIILNTLDHLRNLMARLMKGSIPEWLFDIDSLTKSMNYEPVSVGNQSNGDASIQTDIHAGQASKEKAAVHEYILLSFIPSNPPFSSTIQSLDVNVGDIPGDVNAGDIQVDVDEISRNNDDVWTLVDLPYGKRVIGSKWVFKKMLDERGIVIRNKARLVAQGLHSLLDGCEECILYGKIEEEVYVSQPPGFEDPDFPDKVYNVKKSLYGLQVKQKQDSIFIRQDKYVAKILKNFGFSKVKIVSTLMETSKPLLKYEDGQEVDVHMCRSMIGSLMYLTSSCLDIMFAVCACARHQVSPKASYLHAVKRIFRYLKGQPKLGLWYPKESPFELEAYTDSDYADLVWTGNLRLVDVNSLAVDLYPGSTTAKVKKVDDEVQNQNLVDGKRINIKESSIRRTQRLDDAKGTSCLTNAEIFEGFARMRYENLSDKLTFYKAFFSPQWKFLIHTILQCLSVKITSWNEFSSIMASAIICLATNQKFNFSRYILLSLVKNIKAGVPFFMFLREVTPLFANMLVQAPDKVGILQADAQSLPIPTEPSTSKPQKKHKPKRKHTKEPVVPPTESQAEQNITLPSPSHAPLPSGEDSLKLKELMDFWTNLSNKVLDLESEVIDIKSTYQARIEKLESGVERLEEENRVLKELMCVYSKVDSDEPVMEKEKSSKQGRKIADIDVDVEINLEKA